MKLRKLLILPAIALLLTGCSTVSVNTDYDPQADFTVLKTFSVGASADKDDVLSKNPLALQRVNTSIEKIMQAKGYIKVDNNPDMLVYPQAAVKDKVKVTDWGGPYRGWWGNGPYGWGYGGRIDVTEYTEGYLIIDIVVAESKQLAWRGIGTFTVSAKERTPKESQDRSDMIVGEILGRYPPGK